MRKIYVVGGSSGYARWMEGEVVDNMKNADLVVFTGGEDVHPDFYGEPMNPTAHCNHQRDRYEQAEFNEALELKIPMLGICRGSQFLCVMNGGRLVQHQQNPHYMHDIELYDGNTIEISSTHHQAAYPFDMPGTSYRVLGWTRGISKFHEDGNRLEMDPPVECEIVHYSPTRCLGIQGHPEMLNKNHSTIAYLQDMLNKFLSNTLQNEYQNSSKEGTNIVPDKNTLTPSLA